MQEVVSDSDPDRAYARAAVLQKGALDLAYAPYHPRRNQPGFHGHLSETPPGLTPLSPNPLGVGPRPLSVISPGPRPSSAPALMAN